MFKRQRRSNAQEQTQIITRRYDHDMQQRPKQSHLAICISDRVVQSLEIQNFESPFFKLSNQSGQLGMVFDGQRYTLASHGRSPESARLPLEPEQPAVARQATHARPPVGGRCKRACSWNAGHARAISNRKEAIEMTNPKRPGISRRACTQRGACGTACLELSQEAMEH